MVLLTGSAAVGKSHLAEWLCEDAHELGLVIPLRAKHNRMPTRSEGMVGAVLGYFGIENADRDIIERFLMNIWEVPKNDEDTLYWVAAVAEWLRPTAPGEQVAVGPSGKRFAVNSPQIQRGIVWHKPLLPWLDDLHLTGGK